MDKVVLTEEENRLYLLFRLKAYQDDFDLHVENEKNLEKANKDDMEAKNFVKIVKGVKKGLDDAHTITKSKLDGAPKVS